ncbi:neuropilin-2-like, partial [Ylistrum balloti]|uniref:neuropilin-2-like n=1 Tax=Ylistrum balloti TaxID=509963 RepID=UPI002905B99D
MSKIGEGVRQLHLWITVCMLVHIGHGDYDCADNLITGPFGVDDSSLTVSSYFNEESCYPRFVRISQDLTFCWCPAVSDKSEYLQVEFRHTSAVTALITQGRGAGYQYLKSLTMKTSLDGSNWETVTDESGNIKVYEANNDGTTLVNRTVNEKILAKFIRIHPETWYDWPSFSMEILGYLRRTCWIGKAGVPTEELPVLHQTFALNNGICGKECHKYQSCGSFMFDFDNRECHLYSIQTFNVTTTRSASLGRKVYFVNNPD